MRKTRLLYVEDDPALRSIMAKLLAQHESFDLVVAVNDATAAESAIAAQPFDAALIDIALGSKSINGLELATRLKARNQNMGIIMYSQHASVNFLSELPQNNREGWSVVQKSAQIDIKYLADVINSTVRGLSIIDPRLADEAPQPDELTHLTPRQHEIMAQLVEGIDVPQIAKNLSLSNVTIRQELSRIYKQLVPSPSQGTDLRTTAILKYLRLSRSYSWALNE